MILTNMANDGHETPTQLIFAQLLFFEYFATVAFATRFLDRHSLSHHSTMSDAVDESHLPVLCRSASLSACSVLGSLTVSGNDEAFLRHLWSPYLYWPEICASVRIGPWRASTFGPIGEESSKLSLEVSYKFI